MLTVDGKPFVEARPADLGCEDGTWTCNFRFVGEPMVEFEVYEMDWSGATLDTLARVCLSCEAAAQLDDEKQRFKRSQNLKERKQHQHEIRRQQLPKQRVYNCSITVPGDRDLHSARLTIDGVDFGQLVLKREELLNEGHLTIDAQVLRQSYGITPPYHVNFDAEPGLLGIAGEAAGQGQIYAAKFAEVAAPVLASAACEGRSRAEGLFAVAAPWFQQQLANSSWTTLQCANCGSVAAEKHELVEHGEN